MQVTETAQDGLKREFKIVIPAQDLEQRVVSELEEVGRSVKLPGFRPGKIPLPVLRQRFGDSVRGRVLEGAVQDSSHRLMNERGLRAAGQPKIEVKSFDAGGDLEYAMAIELFPEIKPADFAGYSFERLTVDVAATEVEEALKRLADGNRRSEPVTDGRAAAKGDVAVIDFEGSIDGTPFPGGAATDHYLELGSNSFIPGFEDQVADHKVGDDFVITVTFPAEYGAKELAGKAAQFKIKVKELRALKPYEIDEEFAKAMGVESLEKMRELVKARIEKDYVGLARGRLKRALLDKLAESHDFALPQGLIDNEFDMIWKQIEADQKAGRLDPDDQGKSEDQLKQEYRDIAVRRVKLGLLLSEVGRLNNIEVGNDEISRAVMAEAGRYPGREKQVMDYYRKSPEALAQLRAPIYEEKVVDFILGQAKVTDKKATVEELTAEAAKG